MVTLATNGHSGHTWSQLNTRVTVFDSLGSTLDDWQENEGKKEDEEKMTC